MLAQKVSLGDVADVEGFVAATLDRECRRRQIRLSADEREMLIAEGITILYELASRFEHQRPGYDRPGRFSGYAARLLPLRLASAWHSWHPEHIYAAGPGGARAWSYEAPATSLSEDAEVRAAPPAGDDLEDLGPPQLLVDALASFEPWERFGLQAALSLLDRGYSWSEAAEQLGIPRPRLAALRKRLARVLERMAGVAA